MDEKTQELVAIGASVCAHCQPCVTFHVAKARELGVAEELIREAVAVGQAVEKGAGAARSKAFVEKLPTILPDVGGGVDGPSGAA